MKRVMILVDRQVIKRIINQLTSVETSGSIYGAKKAKGMLETIDQNDKRFYCNIECAWETTCTKCKGVK